MGVRARAGAIFSFRRIWGLGLTLVGLLAQAGQWGWLSLDIFSRLDILWRVVETMGGSPAMIAFVISSWEFSFALIALGVGYTVFVGEPEKHTQRHAWWPYVAASVFFVCLATMASVAIYGAYELQLRRAYDQGRSGIPRSNTPDVPRPDQIPAYSANRQLTPDQIRILSIEFSKLNGVLSNISIRIPVNDNEAWAYRRQFQDILVRAGITNEEGIQAPRGLDDVGLIINVPNSNHIAPSAQKLIEALEVANIHPLVKELPGMSQDFVWFIAPRPLQ